MPWCETCDRFYNPNSLERDGTCRSCGDRIGEPSTTVATTTATTTAEDDAKVPWHFKLMVAAVVAYLAWRAIQGIDWLLG